MNLRTISVGDNPVTLAAARLHCKLTAFGVGGTHPDDALLERLRAAARGHAERYLQRRVAQDVVELRVAAFAREFVLPLAPVTTLAWVKYLDSAGDLQTWDPTNYELVDDPQNPHILTEWNWPSVADRSDAVRMRYTCGYGPHTDPATEASTLIELPHEIEEAMLMMIGHWYENRNSVNVGNIVTEMPLSAVYLLDMHRREMGV
jgi:uncharacterized phiE125 gp8 family phage protein